MQHFILFYNALRMRCSASLTFSSSGTDCCNTRFRKFMYSLLCRISASTNNIVQRIEYSDVHDISVLRTKWIRAICTHLKTV